ncbi:transglutaminase domain-containing protein [Patescibacteria group bacterium]|nr:transglutaminase domain-containing protein [Patescibacteria group bacterium]
MIEDTAVQTKPSIFDRSKKFEDGSLVRANNFFDSTQPIEGVPTSYTSDTPEVMSYRKQIREGDPGTLYEFLQNAFDYNDYSKGPPGIEIVLNDEKIITLGQLLSLSGDQLKAIHKRVTQVRITNYINEDSYYRVEHLIQTRHGGGEGTLGQHGRGGKAGSTALIVEGCVYSIQFSSRDGNGPWKAQGEVGVRPDLFRKQQTPSLNILYQDSNRNQSRKVDKTIVTFNHPDLRFFQLLLKIPEKFLLINHLYQGYRLEGGTNLKPQENLLTIWAGKPNFAGEHSTSFAPEEIKLLSLPDIKFTEIPRVEILPPGIVPNQGYSSRTTRGICVDGLMLESGDTYALQWSFWGCGYGKDDTYENKGYIISRSPESRYAQGNWEKLMALALGKCTNPAVFKAILDNSHDGNSCREGSLPKKELYDSLVANSVAMAAFKQAWDEFSQEHNIASETLFTNDEYVAGIMKERGKPVFRIDNVAFLYVLTIQKWCNIAEHKIAIDEKPQSTGDKIRLPLGTTSSDVVIDRLFEVIIERKHQIKVTKQGLEIELSYPENSPPSSFHHLSPTLRDFIRDFFSLCGKKVAMEVIFDTGAKNSMRYVLTSEQDWLDDSKKTTVSVLSGKIQSEQKDSGAMLIRLSLSDQEDLRPNFISFVEKFMAELQRVSHDGESVDLDLFAEHYSGLERGVFNAELMAQKREMLSALQRIEEEKRKLGIIWDDTQALDATRRSLRVDRNTQRTFTTLFAPNSTPVARNSQFGSSSNGQESSPKEKDGIVAVIDRLLNYTESLKNPDLHLINPQFLPAYARTTLVAAINFHFSGEIPHQPYLLDHGQQKNIAGVRVNQQIINGAHAVPAPLDCQLVGFYHPNPEIQKSISFTAALERNMFSLQANTIIPPGLELYFKYNPDNAATTPATAWESQKLFDVQFLPPEWRGLVSAVREDGELGEKQKCDIALTAWLHAFTYDDDPEIDGLITKEIETLVATGIDPEEARYLAIIKISKGNCGYVSEGFLALVRSLGLESTEAVGYLGDQGRFFPGPHNHGINLVKIDGRWTYVEPQRGYLSDSMSRDSIPAKYKAIIRKLPRGIRNYSSQNVARENTGVREILQELQSRRLVGDPSVKKILEEMMRLIGQGAELYQNLWEDEAAGETDSRESPKGVGTSIESLLENLINHHPNEGGIELDGFSLGSMFKDLIRKHAEEKADLEKKLAAAIWEMGFIKHRHKQLGEHLAIAALVTAVLTAAAISGLMLSQTGIAQELRQLSEVLLPSLHLPEIIARVFTPETIKSGYDFGAIFTLSDIKRIGAILLSAGVGLGLSTGALLMELNSQKRRMAKNRYHSGGYLN